MRDDHEVIDRFLKLAAESSMRIHFFHDGTHEGMTAMRVCKGEKVRYVTRYIHSGNADSATIPARFEEFVRLAKEVLKDAERHS